MTRTSALKAGKGKPAKSRQIRPASSPSLSSAHEHATRSLILQILLARLEADKSYDWYDLSLRLNEGQSVRKDRKKGSKRKKEAVEEQEALSGNELRDVYYDVILPALRRGVMPWEGTSSRDSTPPPLTPPTDDLALSPPAPLPKKGKAPARSRTYVSSAKKAKSQAGPSKTKEEGESDSEDAFANSVVELESEEEM